MLDSGVRLAIREPEVTSKVMDGEAIIINLGNGMYFSADGVGGLVWSLIQERNSLGDIAKHVAGSYEVSHEDALADVFRFGTELIDEELVTPSDEDASPSINDKPVQSNSKLTYTAPQLNKYSDMADMFALDPPLPELPNGPSAEAARKS